MSKPAIISIGAAVQDVFLQGKLFTAHREHGEMVQEFSLGSKNEIEGVVHTTGGGATNAAVTFARQGFHSAYMGRVGKDIAGRAVLENLKEEHVNTALVGYSETVGTGYSSLLLAPNGERTVLTYRGASSHYGLHPSDFQQVEPDWFYVSSLSGDFGSLQVIMKYARKHRIKVAINPGKQELANGSHFKEFLPDISILSVNKEEAAKLFKGETTEELARNAASKVPYVIITDGPKGSIASDGKHLYKAGMYEDVKVFDRTGAGDAFSSGFVAMLAAGQGVEKAITFASANSTSVVAKIGAKAGILRHTDHIHSMPIIIKAL